MMYSLCDSMDCMTTANSVDMRVRFMYMGKMWPIRCRPSATCVVFIWRCNTTAQQRGVMCNDAVERG
jgi:hypothetical protein